MAEDIKKISIKKENHDFLIDQRNFLRIVNNNPKFSIDMTVTHLKTALQRDYPENELLYQGKMVKWSWYKKNVMFEGYDFISKESDDVMIIEKGANERDISLILFGFFFSKNQQIAKYDAMDIIKALKDKMVLHATINLKSKKISYAINVKLL